MTVMNATVNCETGMPSSPNADMTPAGYGEMIPMTRSGSNAVNTDR